MATLDELVKVCRAALHDIGPEEVSQFDYCQLKVDGWWTMVFIQAGHVSVFTGASPARNEFDIPDKSLNCLLIAEWSFGTSRANYYHPGKLFIHDIYQLENIRLSGKDFFFRHMAIEKYVMPHLPEEQFEQLPIYPVSMWKDIWSTLVENDGLEGLVFKKTSEPFGSASHIGRMKPRPNMEYVCTRLETGGGKNAKWLGTVYGALFINGKLTETVAVGSGFSDAQREEYWNNRSIYPGKVFQAHGFQIFPSGSLRHPCFDGWREDKDPATCIWPNPRIKVMGS